MLKLLTFTTLFPNAIEPRRGIFVEHRLRHLVAETAETKVVAPVGYVPFPHVALGRYAHLAKIPFHENRYGIAVYHPRYGGLPKLGGLINPWTLFPAALPIIRRIQQSGFDFDIIDAHVAYPDGFAAALLARYFRKPLTITVRGCDLNHFPRFLYARAMIKWTIQQADGLFSVCDALKDALLSLGLNEGKVWVSYNGVDQSIFFRRNSESTKKKWDIEGRCILSVGSLTERKGHHLSIAAISHFPNTQLIIVGDGPKKRELKRLSTEFGVADRVRFLGSLPQRSLAELYSAADVLLLPSSREGLPNVLLESLACGTPAISTKIWGIPEVLKDGVNGLLLEERSVECIVANLKRFFGLCFNPSFISRSVETFTWDQTTDGQIKCFQEILERPQAGRSSFYSPSAIEEEIATNDPISLQRSRTCEN